MSRYAMRSRLNGRMADFVETLSMIVVGGALVGMALVVAAFLFGWATAAMAV